MGRAITAATLVVLCGCWSTQPLTVAEAPPGTVGYGLEEHIQVIYLVIAGARTRIVSTGHAAYSPEIGPDALWRVHGGGGFRLEHCVGDGLARCTDATFDEKPGRIITLVDPANLGSTITQTTVSGPDSTTVTTNGVVQLDGVTAYEASPNHGVWVRAARSQRLYYCHVASGAPTCQSVGRFGFPLAVMTLAGADPTDVMWVNRFGMIERCTATASRPTPVCQPATIQ